MTVAALIVAGDASEAERLTLRGFDAVDKLDPYHERARFIGRPAWVTPRATTQRADVAAMLHASGCDVRKLREAFDPEHDDPAKHVGERMFADECAPTDSEFPLWPAPLDLHALAAREPRLPEHIVGDFLPAGEVTLFPGHGGGGKSQIAEYLGVCVALERSPWLGVAVQRRRVTYISAEDNADVLHWRLARICAHLGGSISDLAGRLELIDASRIDAELMIDVDGDTILTRAYRELGDRIDRDCLLILDGASDLYGASEIVRRYVRRYVRALRQLIGPRGAVLLLAHIDKTAARDGTSSDRYSGSTAWHNSVRARWSLVSDGEALVLSLAKANYARAGAEVRFRWDADAHLYLPQAPSCADGGLVGSIRDRTERRDILRALAACADGGIYVPSALTGPRTAWHVLSQRDEFPAALRADDRATRGRFWRHIEALRHIAHISDSTIRRGNRHPTATLALTSEGRAECANA